MAKRLSTTSFAKSTRPELGSVVEREGLYARLDGTPARTVAWISAPPGFGKTTLAASYLQARGYRWAWYQVDADDDDGESFFHYLSHAVRHLRGEGAALPVFAPASTADVAPFARRFFRTLFKGAEGPVAIALDNVHELSAESPLRLILEAGLPEVPRQCCVIVTSRTPPPVGLSRLQPGGQMVCIGADDLRIGADELSQMARLRNSSLQPDLLAQARLQTEGWAAALVLMIEHHKLAASVAQMPADSTPTVVFDYLAGEIFERFDAATRGLLLNIACVPRVTIEVAEGLSGDPSAARILFNLAHNDYFVRELVGPEGRVFVLHPLLREFLLHRAERELPRAVDAAAIRKAARLLRDSGQVEDAMALFVAGADWPEAAALAASESPALLVQGRHSLLAGWLELLPPHVMAGSPPLLFAHGSAVARISPRAARRSFEEAYHAFDRRNDRQGMAKCCLGVIEVVLREFDDLTAVDRWLVEFDRCRTLASDDAPAPQVVIAARLWRDPSHPSVAAAVAERDPASASRDVVRATAAALDADFARAAAILKGSGGDADPDRLGRALAEALRHLLDGAPVEARDAARRGLQHGDGPQAPARDAWLHMLCVAASLGLNDLDDARQALERAEVAATRRGDRAFLHLLSSRAASASGDPGLALREAKGAVLLAVEAGIPWAEALARVTIAQLLAATGDRQGAFGQLRTAEAVAAQTGSPTLRLSHLFAQAGVALLLSDEGAARHALEQGLDLARELGARHIAGLLPAVLGRLCAHALRHGVAPDHARLLVGTAALTPPAEALRLRQWPWGFQITTFGSFELLRSGDAIEFSAKGPGRPVELLKLLVSQGGQNVRVDQLADTLWPHVDADYAHQSFTATLHRLRRILGGEDTLKLRDGRLSLNDALFWLDIRALDEVMSAIELVLRESDARAADEPLRVLLEEALSLYRGPFLADESEHPAYLARREQIRGRLLRTLARAARHLEAGGRAQSAIDAYQRCIDADEQCEAFYRNLMLCHQRLGETGEALGAYERLRAVLAARSKTEPSPETRAIRASLQP